MGYYETNLKMTCRKVYFCKISKDKNGLMQINFKKTVLSNHTYNSLNEHFESNEIPTDIKVWGTTLSTNQNILSKLEDGDLIIFLDGSTEKVYGTLFSPEHYFTSSILSNIFWGNKGWVGIFFFTSLVPLDINFRTFKENVLKWSNDMTIHKLFDNNDKKNKNKYKDFFDNYYQSIHKTINSTNHSFSIPKNVFPLIDNPPEFGTLYLVWSERFKNFGEYVYKFGKTAQFDNGRLKDYGDNCVIIRTWEDIPINQLGKFETQILQNLKDVSPPHEGNEYFKINKDVMINVIQSYYDDNIKDKEKVYSLSEIKFKKHKNPYMIKFKKPTKKINLDHAK